jgi:hypothetical protein
MYPAVVRPMVPPFRVEYYCPRQGHFWQSGNAPPQNDYVSACAWANLLKPPQGSARVLDAAGEVVFYI